MILISLFTFLLLFWSIGIVVNQFGSEQPHG